MPPLPAPCLCVITDETLEAATTESVIEKARGASPPMVQLRMRSMCGAEIFRLAMRLRTVTREHESIFIVHDRIDVALAIDADGAHLPGAGMASTRARALVGPERLLGRSVHSLEDIDREKVLGAVDYLQFGPVFPTPSKAVFGEPQGLARLAEAVRGAAPIPIVAVGGITSRNAGEIVRAGACGAAVIAAVMRAPDPRQAVHELTAALVRARPSSC